MRGAAWRPGRRWRPQSMTGRDSPKPAGQHPFARWISVVVRRPAGTVLSQAAACTLVEVAMASRRSVSRLGNGVDAGIGMLKGRTRRAAGRLIRASGLLPGGQPNGLADDALVAQWASGQCPRIEVMAYFADPPTNMYQLR